MAGIPRGFERYRPWWRGWYQGYGFNPVADLPGLAFYHDIKVQDSTFQGLPGMAYAINQNDGIGAVLDLKRYKERGANVVTQDGSAWSAGGSSPNQWTVSGSVASVNNTGGTASCYLRHAGSPLTAGKLYAVTFTVLSSNGVGGVRAETATDNVPDYITSTGTHTVLLRAVGAAPSQFQFQANVGWIGSIDLSTVTVREVPGHHAIQDLAAAQPVLNIEGGVRSALFDGVDDRLVIPNSAGAFNFLHDGTGGEIHWCGRASALDIVRYLFGNGNASRNGCIASAAPNGSVGVSIGNASGTYAASATAPIGTLTVGEIAVIGFSLTSGTLTIFKNGQVCASAAVSGELSSGDPEFDFTVGRWSPNSGSCFSGDIYSVAPVQGILSDYQRQRLAAYMLRRAGA